MKKVMATAIAALSLSASASRAEMDYLDIAAMMYVANEHCGKLFSSEVFGNVGMLAAGQEGIFPDPEIIGAKIAIRAFPMERRIEDPATRERFCAQARRVAGKF